MCVSVCVTERERNRVPLAVHLKTKHTDKAERRRGAQGDSLIAVTDHVLLSTCRMRLEGMCGPGHERNRNHRAVVESSRSDTPITNFELLLRSEFDRLGLSPELLMVSTWGLHQGVRRTPKHPHKHHFHPSMTLTFRVIPICYGRLLAITP